MKRSASFALALAAAFALPSAAQLQTPRPSPNGSVMQTIGVTDVTVTYSRPAVKGRKIWGELVPYGEVWRTGANEATKITFGDDVTVGGSKLAAGRYSLHTIPGKDEWTVIFNKQADQWGSYNYEEKQDALRIKVKPQAAPAETERLTISFPAVTDSSAQLAIDWEKVRVVVPIEVDTTKIMAAKAKDAVAKAKAEDWQTPLQASRWARDNKMTAEADEWLAKSIATKETLGNLFDKAKLQAAQGKTSEAIATAKKALEAGKTQEPKPSAQAVAGVEKQIAEWSAKK